MFGLRHSAVCQNACARKGCWGSFHFCYARPDEVVMSPPLRCGFPGRIAFKVAFEEDSRMIIDENGADLLNGKGDFLFRDSAGLHRGQAQYISDEDFESLCAR